MIDDHCGGGATDLLTAARLALARAGDRVTVGEVRYELVGAPFTGMCSASWFDTPERFWRALVRVADEPAGAVTYVTWREKVCRDGPCECSLVQPQVPGDRR